MRHGKFYRKLGRDSAHRMAMLKNLSRSLIEHGRIETTLNRAKELRSYVEKMVTLGKKNTIHHRRLAFAKLRSEALVKKLFDELSPKYAERKGGYTRIMRGQIRRGDSAKMAIIEFV